MKRLHYPLLDLLHELRAVVKAQEPLLLLLPLPGLVGAPHLGGMRGAGGGRRGRQGAGRTLVVVVGGGIVAGGHRGHGHGEAPKAKQFIALGTGTVRSVSLRMGSFQLPSALLPILSGRSSPEKGEEPESGARRGFLQSGDRRAFAAQTAARAKTRSRRRRRCRLSSSLSPSFAGTPSKFYSVISPLLNILPFPSPTFFFLSPLTMLGVVGRSEMRA